MKKIFLLAIFFALLFCINAGSLHASDAIPGAGFIQKNIWYSKEPIAEGDTVTIYTIVFNPEKTEITGVVTFHDKDIILGTRKVTIEKGGYQSVSIDWKVTAGDHSISATLSDTKTIIFGKTETITLANTNTGEDIKFVPKKITDEKKADESNSMVSDGLNSAVAFVDTNTPVASWVSKIDDLRVSLGAGSDAHKDAIKENIKKEFTEPAKGDTAEKSSSPKRVFEYVKYFFFTFVSYVFNHKILFYPLLILFTFLILRFIYRIIFK